MHLYNPYLKQQFCLQSKATNSKMLSRRDNEDGKINYKILLEDFVCMAQTSSQSITKLNQEIQSRVTFDSYETTEDLVTVFWQQDKRIVWHRSFVTVTRDD